MSQQNQPKVKQILNATIVTGEYTDSQGQNKKSYLTIGTLFIFQDGGMSLKLDAVPTNGQNIVFYHPKPKEHNRPTQNQNGQQQNGSQNYQQQTNHNGNGQQQQNYNNQNQGY